MKYKTKLNRGDKFWWVRWLKIGPVKCESCGNDKYIITRDYQIVEDKVDEILVSDGPSGFVKGYAGIKSKEIEFPAFIIGENQTYKSKASAKRGAKRVITKKIYEDFALAC